MIALFHDKFVSLLPYMECLLYGGSISNSSKNGDMLYPISDGRGRDSVYRTLERVGRAYDRNLRLIIETAASIGLLQHIIDLSLDATHLMYHGTKRLKKWGAPFSTWLNRSFPGLNPTTAYDLASGLFLYMFDFICKASVSNRAYGKGKVMLGRVKGCVEFLKDASIRVRSVTGDEAFFSYPLLKWLVDSKVSYRLAVSSRSVLRGYLPQIKGWTSMKDGRLIGTFRGAVYRGIETNLLAVKHHGSTFLYVTSTRSLSALEAMKEYWRRGRHEKAIGYMKKFLSLARIPSTKLFRIKGHVLTCIFLHIILTKVAKEMNVVQGGAVVSPSTMKSILSRRGVVKIVRGDRGMTTSVMAIVAVNKALARKLGRSRIEVGQSVIEFIRFNESRSNKGAKDFFRWNT